MQKIGVFILTPEVACSFGVLVEACPYRYDLPPRMKPWVLPDPCHYRVNVICLAPLGIKDLAISDYQRNLESFI